MQQDAPLLAERAPSPPRDWVALCGIRCACLAQGSKKSDAEVEVEWLMRAGYKALMDVEKPPPEKANTIVLAGGYELKIGSGVGAGGTGGGLSRGALPKGTTRK